MKEEERTIVEELEKMMFSIDPDLQNSSLAFILFCSRKLLRWFEQEGDQIQFSFLQMFSLDFRTMACERTRLMTFIVSI